MNIWKLRLSDRLTTSGVSVNVFVAPGPDRTFQKCGELILTPEEADDLKERLEK